MTIKFLISFLFSEDMDECIDPRRCAFTEECTNTMGSYTCDCIAGHHRLDGVCAPDPLPEPG